MRQGLSLGRRLTLALQKCRNCGRAGAAWGPEQPPWDMHLGMMAWGVCSQRCNDRLVERIRSGEWGNPMIEPGMA
jgi:hypothetical protein